MLQPLHKRLALQLVRLEPRQVQLPDSLPRHAENLAEDSVWDVRGARERCHDASEFELQEVINLLLAKLLHKLGFNRKLSRTHKSEEKKSIFAYQKYSKIETQKVYESSMVLLS